MRNTAFSGLGFFEEGGVFVLVWFCIVLQRSLLTLQLLDRLLKCSVYFTSRDRRPCVYCWSKSLASLTKAVAEAWYPCT